MMKPKLLSLFIFFIFTCNFFRHDNANSTDDPELDPEFYGSIVFNSGQRPSYNFDIYTLPVLPYDDGQIQHSSLSSPTVSELKITDGISINFNGHFPNPKSSPFSLLANNNQTFINNNSSNFTPLIELVYVTERNGRSSIYYDALMYNPATRLRSLSDRLQVPLVVNQEIGRISMKDRPCLAGEFVIYVSNHDGANVPGMSWAAVYSTHLRTRFTRRLTPEGVADFSPAVSPSGIWTAVASSTGIETVTDIYIFLTRDGSKRAKIVDEGGWPCWVDDQTIYFHRRSKDGWWSVYRARLPEIGQVIVERVTPSGVHAFTPATSPGNKFFIAVATRRPNSKYRQIELFDLITNEFKEMTPAHRSHHFNPFLSSDGTRVGYHRCRGAEKNTEEQEPHLFLESLESPIHGLSITRLDGSFPSFSPDANRIAYTKLPGLYVVDRDGLNQREVFKGMAFSTAWDPIRRGLIYTSAGPAFASERTNVDILSIDVDSENVRCKRLTHGGKNNGFPSASPDGKWVVFRSSRSGHKNLYVMDAENGEMGGIYRLTKGPWTDTHCNWSPDGRWIVFSSNRDQPGSSNFDLYLIHPDGTGVRKLTESGLGVGQSAAHPWFSPDGKSVVFAANYGGISAEPISTPRQFEPGAEIFVVRVDGTGMKRLTYNSYEDGTPTWGPRFMGPVDVAQASNEPNCRFDDYRWLNTKASAAPLNQPGSGSMKSCLLFPFCFLLYLLTAASL